MTAANHPSPFLHAALDFHGTKAVPYHEHPFTELVLVKTGAVTIGCNRAELQAGAHAVFVLPARVAHDQRTRGSWHTHCVIYGGGEHLLATQPRVLDCADDPLSLRWIADLVALTSANDTRAGDGLLLALLTRLGTRDQRRASVAALPPAVASALDFLAQHLTDDISNAQVARAAGVSVSHLGGLFRTHVGCGPLAHLQRLRMTRATTLLRNPYMELPMIATSCGIRDVNYFIRLFRRVHGQPPARWRRMQTTVR